jgi:hypothetical protein
MEKQGRENSLNGKEFKRMFGVSEDTFEKMLGILEAAYARQHKYGGKPPRVTVKDRLLISLQYLREYRTMEHIGYDWGIKRSRVCQIVKWVENTLIKDGTFHLPGKKVLRDGGGAIEKVVVDVTESPIERPKKNKKAFIPARKSGIR